MGSRLQELQVASQHGTPDRGLQEWKQQGTQVVEESRARPEIPEEELAGDGGGAEMQQQKEIRGELLIGENYTLKEPIECLLTEHV